MDIIIDFTYRYTVEDVPEDHLINWEEDIDLENITDDINRQGVAAFSNSKVIGKKSTVTPF